MTRETGFIAVEAPNIDELAFLPVAVLTVMLVEPIARPVTTPSSLTEATPDLLLLHCRVVRAVAGVSEGVSVSVSLRLTVTVFGRSKAIFFTS